METNVNYTIVGLFVITMVTAIVLAIIWLSSGFSFVGYSTYMVYMQESVTGLTTDSPVEYNGVNVGRVRAIELNHKNPHLVELLLDINNRTPITQGTVAMLSTRGITGMTFIALKDDSTDLRPLIKLPGQTYPVIKTAPSLFLRLDAALTQITDSFHKVSESVQALLDAQNLQSIKDTLSNLKQITGTLSVNSAKLGMIIDNTSKASQQFGPLIQSSQGTVRMIETQTLPTMYRTLNNLNDMTRTMSEISAEIKQNPSMLIRGVAPKPPGPGEAK